MGGDYTRFTYRPEDAHSAVLMQQGRVQLDADWNELMELVARRLRVETVDVIGRCGVPKQTLQGFRIGGSVSAGLTIGVGRCYVDGLLADNRGTGEDQLEPVWGEAVHKDPTPYLGQPHLRPAPEPPTSAGPHLAFLDVWEREVGAAEDPDLVEPAVGVDTANRLQTVWAVRILEDVGAGTTCDSDWDQVTKWAHTTRPSGARLATAAKGGGTPEHPCHVAPSGGYRGVDNRLYRVELHDDGAPDGPPASFKWSRDNGAVAAEVRSIGDETQALVTVGVRRVGRDGELRFKDGDWVELTDDKYELSGRPGVMGKIAPGGVDAQANELTLIGPLKGTVDTARHARARRWDQQQQVNADGVIEIGATPSATAFELEHGVQVSFDLEAPGTFHVGDYWMFAARAGAEEGTVEELDYAPPRGIRHHYCRLAIIENGAPTDCRVLYPPDPPGAEACCDCDVCVTPESHADGTLTIQDAIDRIEKKGGKVCLGVGTYKIVETIRIWNARSLTVGGKGVSTVIEHRGDGPAIDVLTSIDVTIDHLSVAGLRGKRSEVDIGVAIRNSIGVTLQRCLLSEAEALTGAKGKLGASAGKAGRAGIGIGLAGFVAEVGIRENVVIADIGVAALPALGPVDPSDGARSIGNKNAAAWKSVQAGLKAARIEKLQRYLVTHGLWIEDNLFACERVGVDLGRGGRLSAGIEAPAGLVLYLGETRVADNAIYLCTEAGILAAGIVPAERSVLQREFGNQLDQLVATVLKIAVAGGVRVSLPTLGGAALAGAVSGARLDIVRNQLTVLGWGIVHACDQTRVAGNDVGAFGTATALTPGGGIVVLLGPLGTVLSGVEIVDNRVRGVGAHAIAILTGVESARVCDNTAERIGGCGVFTASAAASTLVVSGNHLLDVARAARPGFSGVALLINGAARADVEGNVIDGVGGDDVAVPLRAGIVPLIASDYRVTGNQVRSLGPGTAFVGEAHGIFLGSDSIQRALVDGNVVRIDPAVGGGNSLVWALVAEAGGLTIIRNKIAGFGEGNIWAENFYAAQDPKEGATVSVHGNLLEAGGRVAPVSMYVRGTLAFSDNVCRLSGSAQQQVASITVRGGGASLHSNHFYGPSPVALRILPEQAGPGTWKFTAVGNMANGTMTLGLIPFPAPWDNLNVKI
jgi:hypothetical protein